MSRTASFWLALALLFSGVMMIWQIWKRQQSRPLATSEVLRSASEPRPAGEQQAWIHDFELTERSGRVFDSGKEMPGQVWVTSVFFSSCNKSCRQQNAIVQELQNRFREQQVRFLSITCDPETDTPDQLRSYARQFDADPQRWLFLSGDLQYIRRIAAERFEIAADNDEKLGPGHSDQFTVTDKWGNNRGRFIWHDSGAVDALEQLVGELLAEVEDPAKKTAVTDATVGGLEVEEGPPEPALVTPAGQ
ncbi:MAG: SCO family protein [Planctomycetota bacterium]|nr:SCO family protein [Planctomycetota bacterium]